MSQHPVTALKTHRQPVGVTQRHTTTIPHMRVVTGFKTITKAV